mgnify:CR=1 FL=1
MARQSPPGVGFDLISWCASIPWENMLVRPKFEVPPVVGKAKNPVAATPPPITPRAAPVPAISKPGCAAADNAIVAKGHLEGLARGLGGFGVLRVSKEKLEEGAAAAQQVGHPQLADKMRQVAQAMPAVSTPEQAKALAEQLEPVVQEAWHLGRTCKGALTPTQISKAKELAQQVKAGTLTMDEAIKRVKRD